MVRTALSLVYYMHMIPSGAVEDERGSIEDSNEIDE